MPGVEQEQGLSEAEQVERWRCRELRKAGYDREAAQVLAICADVDLHDAIRLLEAGCEQDVALKILL